MEGEKLSYKIRGAIYEVHRLLGPGLFEECYHQALVKELGLRGMKVQSKVRLPVIYKGSEIKNAYEADILVENQIIVELKSVEELNALHYKQLLNYLHLRDLYLGFLVNFNTEFIVENQDIKRVFNNQATIKQDL